MQRDPKPSWATSFTYIPAVAPRNVQKAPKPVLTTASSEPGSGRDRTRIRHPHRASRLRTLCTTETFKTATINARGLDWRRLDNADKLQGVIDTIRRRNWDITTLTELHGSGTAYVIVEEFLCIFHERVAVVLNVAARAGYEAAGRQVFPISKLALSVVIKFQGRAQPIWFVACYWLTGLTAVEAAEQWKAAGSIYEALVHRGAHQWWMGDWNSHVGKEVQPDGERRGCHALKTLSTTAGRAQMHWALSTDLVHIDSMHPVVRRGTWRHYNGTWYEIDYSMVSPALKHAVIGIKTGATSFSDHMYKEYTCRLPTDGNTTGRQRRKEKFQRFARVKKLWAERDKQSLRFALLRGPSAEAAARRLKLEEVVSSKMLALIPPPWHGDTPHGFPRSEDSHIFFTDGSGESGGVTAGWGSAYVRGDTNADIMCAKGKPAYIPTTRVWHGPVTRDRDSPMYVGASSCTNNTGEMSGISFPLQFLEYLGKSGDSEPATIYYDSEYAASMAMGKWRPKSNIDQARALRIQYKRVKQKRKIRMLHLYAHEGHFGNEVADVAADQGRLGHVRLPLELKHRWPEGLRMGEEGEGTNDAPTEERREEKEEEQAPGLREIEELQRSEMDFWSGQKDRQQEEEEDPFGFGGGLDEEEDTGGASSSQLPWKQPDDTGLVPVSGLAPTTTLGTTADIPPLQQGVGGTNQGFSKAFSS